jgi:hypothetical protein
MVSVDETEVVVFIYTRKGPDAHEKRVTIPLDRIESIGYDKSTVG